MQSFTRTIIENPRGEPESQAHVIIRLMRRLLKTLAILVLVVLMPLRAVASVTVGVCATGHGETPVAAHSDHGHGHDAGGHAHHAPEDTSKSSAPTCSSCVEHCSGAAFAPAAEAAVAAPVIDGGQILFAGRIAPAFFPDQLDRPPLA